MAKTVEKKDGDPADKTLSAKAGRPGRLSKKMEAALNAQITVELYSAYLYQSLAAWLESEGFSGSAGWMSIQAREEMGHAARFYRYILERGGVIRLGAIEAPPVKSASLPAAFQSAYDHELKVTALIHNLVGLARAENDYGSEIFLQWFVTEQIEEEATGLEIIRKFEISGGDQGPGLYLIDKELGARTLDPVTANLLLTGQVTA